MQPILIDTDAGDDIDDVLAIAFAARRPELELLGVTTVTADVRRRAALVRQVLAATGRADVPVVPGLTYPMRPLTDDERQNLFHERRMNHCPPASESGNDAASAVDFLADAINRRPGEVVLVGIGPLTNIAALLIQRPEVAPKLKAVALMGGETAILRGEHNIMVDPVAAAVVLSSGLPTFLGTLDVTRRVVLMPDDMATLARRGGGLTTLLCDMARRWHPFHSSKPGPVMYDLAPILWAFRPELFTTRATGIDVDLTGTRTRGWTVPNPKQSHVAVTESMDAPAAHRLLMDTLLQ